MKAATEPRSHEATKGSIGLRPVTAGDCGMGLQPVPQNECGAGVPPAPFPSVSRPHNPLTPLPDWLSRRLGACSTDARLLLAEYRSRGATCEARAIPDGRMSRVIDRPERDLIDFVRELLTAGCVMRASGKGRWFVPPGDADQAIRDAREEADRLDARACDIHVRAKLLREACNLYDQHRSPTDSTGQGRFDLAIEEPASKRLRAFYE